MLPHSLICFILLTDCGVPPTVMSSYCNLGQTTIGAVRQYACDDGYDMSGSGSIECLNTGEWSVPSFTCSGK